MTQPTALRLRQLTSPRRQHPAGRPGRRAAALLLRLAGAALLAWIGYIHLHLWLEGYRQIPTDGPLFLADAVAGFALAAALLTWPRPLAGLAAAGYIASDIGALLISLTVGLFGFKESISAAYVVQTLTIETIALLALLTWTVLAAATPGPPARRQRRGASPSQPRDRDSQTAASLRPPLTPEDQAGASSPRYPPPWSRPPASRLAQGRRRSHRPRRIAGQTANRYPASNAAAGSYRLHLEFLCRQGTHCCRARFMSTRAPNIGVPSSLSSPGARPLWHEAGVPSA
jgi:hypothetical protein